MNLAAWIGLRYYRARSAGGFVSLVSLVSFLGLVLGIIAMIVVVSVMNGFDRELKSRILGAVPHVVVAGTPDLAVALRPFQVASVTPFREENVLLVSRAGSHLLRIHAIDPRQVPARLAGAMVRGSLQLLEGESVELILGASVVRRFGLRAGERVSLVIPRVSEAGETLRPGLVAARLVGSFAMGSEMDYRLGVMSLDDLQKVLPGPVDTRLTLHNIFMAPLVSRHLAEQGMQVKDWTGEFGDFFQAVRMEKIMMFILLSFVVAVASFGIVSGLTMLVSSKRRDIAVLRTMGMGQCGVLGIFLMQGLGITLTGVAAGLLLGVPIAWYIPDIMGLVQALSGFSIVAGTYFDQIPVDIRWPDVVAVTLVATMISFLATLYPCWRAARMNPAEVLRYE